jgi:hypothetical protein
MAGRTRTTKKLAQRIDRGISRKIVSHPPLEARAVGRAHGVGLVWLGWSVVSGKQALTRDLWRTPTRSSNDCQSCHMEALWGTKTSDMACITCHDAPCIRPSRRLRPSARNATWSTRTRSSWPPLPDRFLHAVPLRPESEGGQTQVRPEHQELFGRPPRIRGRSSGTPAGPRHHQAEPPGSPEEGPEGTQRPGTDGLRRLPPGGPRRAISRDWSNRGSRQCKTK